MTKLELVIDKLERVSSKDLDSVDEFIEKILSLRKRLVIENEIKLEGSIN
ncbi:MAG TPA: hypothetical protein PKA90_16450 [Ignavibacteria bacterium]|nr:hypothetical protein [Ignavibacteria bacterium]HMR42009.1 hypothetical protein [Ignavibacteria bacterium]